MVDEVFLGDCHVVARFGKWFLTCCFTIERAFWVFFLACHVVARVLWVFVMMVARLVARLFWKVFTVLDVALALWIITKGLLGCSDKCCYMVVNVSRWLLAVSEWFLPCYTGCSKFVLTCRHVTLWVVARGLLGCSKKFLVCTQAVEFYTKSLLSKHLKMGAFTSLYWWMDSFHS